MGDTRDTVYLRVYNHNLINKIKIKYSWFQMVGNCVVSRVETVPSLYIRDDTAKETSS